MHELEKGVTRVEQVDAPFVPIFDGMTLVRMVKCTGLTFNKFADDLLKLVVAKSCGSKRMDEVFGVYWENFNQKFRKRKSLSWSNSVQFHHWLR